jgi:hypothetical protein
MKQQLSGEIRSGRRPEDGPLLVRAPSLLTPWTSQVLGAFGERDLHIRRFLASIFLTAGVYALTPILDVASYLFRSQPWAAGLYRVSGFVFVTGAAMSLAATQMSLGDRPSAGEPAGIRLSRGEAVFFWATVLGVAAGAVYRFLPVRSTAGPALIALDLALLALFALTGPAGNRKRPPQRSTVPAGRPADGPDERKAA